MPRCPPEKLVCLGAQGLTSFLIRRPSELSCRYEYHQAEIAQLVGLSREDGADER